jgi:hypothetical protein
MYDRYPKLDFQDFLKSRRHVECLKSAGIADVEEEGLPGNVYLDVLHVEDCGDNPKGRWMLTLGNDGWMSDRLDALEKKLWDWAEGEGYAETGWARVAHAYGELARVVGNLNVLYDCHPEVNAIELPDIDGEHTPQSHEVLPMSIDEWACALKAHHRGWVEKAWMEDAKRKRRQE